MGLGQDPPDLGAQSERVRQHLEDDVALRGPEPVMSERGQAEGMGGAVGQIEAALKGERGVLRVREPRQAGAHESRELPGVRTLLR